MLLKMTILGMLFICYGVLGIYRRHDARKYAESPVNVEKAKADMQKIRSADENCVDGKGVNCRFADAPQLSKGDAFKNMDGKNPLGKAFKEMSRIEQRKFDEFKKLDNL